MKKAILIIILSALFNMNSWAQQETTLSNYYFNPMNINPAYAGSRADLSANIIHRSQWVGIGGAPTTESVNLSGLFKKYHVGWGAQVYTDAAGPIRNTNFQLAAAYHLKIGEKTKLSFGLQGAISSIRVAWDKVNLENSTDQSFTNVSSKSFNRDLNFGIYLYHEKYFAAASATHLLESPFNLDNSGNNMAKFYRHYYLTGGMIFKVNDDIDFRPSLLAKYVQAAPLNIGLMESLIFYKKFTAGVGLQGSKRLSMKGMDMMFMALAECKIGRGFRVGYNYEAGINAVTRNHFGSHEVLLEWDMTFKKIRKSTTIMVNVAENNPVQE